MKQEFEMKQEEMDGIIQINKDQMPVMKIGTVTTGMDLAEKVNSYWKGLGNKYGFEHMTVEGSSKGKLFFLAEPKPIVKPKTQTEIEIDKYLNHVSLPLGNSIRSALSKIIKQLEPCDYECIGGPLVNNVAFMALKKMSK